MASFRRNTNLIHSLVDENGSEVEPDCLKSHISDYLMKFYKKLGVRRPKLNGVRFRRIFSSMRVWSERPFEEEDIKRVVWSIANDKTPP